LYSRQVNVVLLTIGLSVRPVLEENKKEKFDNAIKIEVCVRRSTLKQFMVAPVLSPNF